MPTKELFQYTVCFQCLVWMWFTCVRTQNNVKNFLCGKGLKVAKLKPWPGVFVSQR